MQALQRHHRNARLAQRERDTTELAVKRFERDVLAHRPTHVCIMFGLNDAWRPAADGPPLVALDRYVANLKQMIGLLRERRITPVLMTSNPFLTPASNVWLKPYIEACRKVARDERVALVDLYGRFAELEIETGNCRSLYSDDCHMNVEGNVFIADMLTASLEHSLGAED